MNVMNWESEINEELAAKLWKSAQGLQLKVLALEKELEAARSARDAALAMLEGRAEKL